MIVLLRPTGITGRLIGMLEVLGKEDLIITCKSGITLRTAVSSIKEAGRATQGVTLIKLDEGDEIAAISKIEDQEAEEEQIKNDETSADQTGNTNEISDNESESSNNPQ